MAVARSSGSPCRSRRRVATGADSAGRPLGALAAAPPLRRLRGGLRLRVPDLLEHLAHSRTQERPRLGIGVPVAAANARRLARVDIAVWLAPWLVEGIGHGGIVGRAGAGVNGLG